ncbi:helix-turn-helix domain-containing protein [Actinobacillus minor]|uniref:helix-turn-helix domain-containing protein n=1 Tax=Actinobacillus minor TaxID=51047 RepID=UPI0023F22518|nr:helix-turn-helix domain-containing protein [Actinobacillus minor]MDD6911561.1 helix-turn-helix domain-containing protein [Actinobacillus minor]MDY4714241.1 helix-turn-helix domain-containing protein [Actinobacillus minor]
MLRESKSLTQAEMADRLGMSTNGYAKIERGETRLTIPKLEQIVEVFDTDILELISLGENKVVYIQDSDNHSINIINPTSQDLASEIIQLKQTISHQQEMLSAKNELIALQKSQLETLQKMVEKLSQ